MTLKERIDKLESLLKLASSAIGDGFDISDREGWSYQCAECGVWCSPDSGARHLRECNIGMTIKEFRDAEGEYEDKFN